MFVLNKKFLTRCYMVAPDLRQDWQSQNLCRVIPCAAYLLLSSTNRFPVKSTTGSGSQTRPVHYTVQGQAAHISATSCLSSSALGLDANLRSNFTNRVARRLICAQRDVWECGGLEPLLASWCVFISKPVSDTETSDGSPTIFWLGVREDFLSSPNLTICSTQLRIFPYRFNRTKVQTQQLKSIYNIVSTSTNRLSSLLKLLVGIQNWILEPQLFRSH